MGHSCPVEIWHTDLSNFPVISSEVFDKFVIRHTTATETTVRGYKFFLQQNKISRLAMCQLKVKTF